MYNVGHSIIQVGAICSVSELVAMLPNLIKPVNNKHWLAWREMIRPQAAQPKQHGGRIAR